MASSRTLACLLLALLLCSCQELDAAAVKVTVIGLPEGTRTLAARVRMNDKPAARQEEFQADLSSLGFDLPAGAMGTFTLDLEAVDAKRCVLAGGRGEVEIAGPRRYELSVTLTHQDPICWEYPAPQGNMLYAIWGASAMDVWAVGDAGTIVHWDGAAWTRMEQRTPETLRAVWGSAGTDVWAVGDRGAALHWDGGGWKAVTCPTGKSLKGIWGSAREVVWAVGTDGIFRWDGARWGEPDGRWADLTAISGIGPTEAFAVYYGGAVLRYDGASWSKVFQAPATIFLSVWNGAHDDVWVGGPNGIGYHYDGSSWTYVMGDASGSAFGFWGPTKDNVWLVGSNQWVLHRTSPGTPWGGGISANFWNNAIWGSAPDDIWAVGGDHTIQHFDGVEWSVAVKEDSVDVRGLYASGPDDIWAGGGRDGSVILHYDGRSWVNWARIDGRLPSLGYLFDIGGSGANDVFAVGSGVLHWDGKGWSLMTVPTGAAPLFDVWGVPGDTWAVGEKGAVLRWHGGTWSRVPIRGAPTDDLHEVKGSGPDDVWVSGRGGIVLRCGGSMAECVVQSVPIPQTAVLKGLWVGARDDVWVSDQNVAYHFTGSSWTMTRYPDAAAGAPIKEMWGRSPSDVWAVGAGGVILHWDGVEWTLRRRVARMEVNTVVGLDSGEVLFGGGDLDSNGSRVAGGNGILRYHPAPR